MSVLTPPIAPLPEDPVERIVFLESVLRQLRADIVINEASATATADHGGLDGLADDDHTQYSLVSGTRAFTGTVVGVAPTADLHLATKKYGDDFNTVTNALIVQGDGTTGRVLRFGSLTVDDGTNAATLKCTLVSMFNGDAIAETDNVAKGATTGSWTLSASGKELLIEAAGLSGNVVATLGVMKHNASGDNTLYADVDPISNDIALSVRAAGATVDLTTLVDTGIMVFNILYITDA